MRSTRLPRFGLKAFALLLCSVTCWAAPVTWTLNNVQTVGGVTVTGSFVYDADTNTYSDIDLSASNGKTFNTMLRSTTDTINNNRGLFFPYESPVVAGTSLTIGFASGEKTNRGGQVNLSLNAQSGGIFTCANSTCSNVTPTADSQWASGSLVAVSPYPFVDSLSEIVGPTQGGRTITLTGIGLTGATDVMFGSVSAGLGNFTVVNDTTITVTVPAQASGTVKVKVVKAGGTTPTSNALNYEYFAPTATNTRIITSGSTTSNIANATATDVGVEVKGIYNYTSSRSEVKAPSTPNSTYRWALSSVSTGAGPDHANGANATGSTLGGVTYGGRPPVVTNLNAISYTPVTADLGKYLYYCVTPAALLGAVGPEACSAAIPVGTVEGACGSANSVASVTAPAANLCTAGSAGVVSGSNGAWGWTCSGFNGGQTASCSAPYASQSITLSAHPSSLVLGGTSTLTASGGASGLMVTLTPNANCTLSSTTVTATAVGICTVTASQAGSGDSGTNRYLAASSQSVNIAVSAAVPTPLTPPIPVVEQGSNISVSSGAVQVSPTASNAQAPGELIVNGEVQMLLGGTDATTMGVQSVGDRPAQIRFTQTVNGTVVPQVQSGTAVFTIPTPSGRARPVLPIVTQPSSTDTPTPRMVTTADVPCVAGSTTLRVAASGGGVNPSTTRVDVGGCPVKLMGLDGGTTASAQTRAVTPGTRVHDGATVYPGEQMVLDANNTLIAIQLGSTSAVTLAGTGLDTGSLSGLSDHSYVPRLQGAIQRLNNAELSQLLTTQLQGMPTLSDIWVMGDTARVLLSYEGRRHLFRAIGRIHVNTDLTPPRQASAQGGVVIDAEGIAVEFVPSVLNLATLGHAVVQDGGSLRVQADGSYVATLTGVPHVFKATTELRESAQANVALPSGLTPQGRELLLNLHFGYQQTLVPAAADLEGLRSLARSLDMQAQVSTPLASAIPGSEASVLANSMVALSLHGVAYRLQPEMALVPVPAVRLGQLYWTEAGKLYVPAASVPGWAQVFLVR